MCTALPTVLVGGDDRLYQAYYLRRLSDKVTIIQVFDLDRIPDFCRDVDVVVLGRGKYMSPGAIEGLVGQIRHCFAGPIVIGCRTRTEMAAATLEGPEFTTFFEEIPDKVLEILQFTQRNRSDHDV